MTTLSTAPIPGTRDFFPDEMSVRTQIFERLYRVVESFGYARYDAPMVEPFELYAAKSGQELVNQQVYRLTDRGGRELALRPEMTPSVARMIAARAGALTLPARWYSHPNLYRYERKQRGRYREHWQVNVDLFGTESWEAEAEVFEVAAEMMFSLGARTEDFLVRVSDRALVKGALEGHAKVEEARHAAVFGALDQFEKIGEAETRSLLSGAGLSAEQADRVIEIVTASAERFLALAPADVVERSNVARVLREGLTTSKPVQLTFDPLIIRGFEYYTTTVFEIYDTDPQNRRSIAGGGRYDNLVALFGKTRVPGIGFGMGDVTLVDFLDTHGLAPRPRVAPDVLVVAPDASSRGDVKELAAALRAAGLRVVTPLEARKLGKQIERAAREGIRCVVIAGPDERARDAAKLRDLERSEEKEIARGRLADAIREISARSQGGGP